MTYRRVENTRVHFWTFSPVSVKSQKMFIFSVPEPYQVQLWPQFVYCIFQRYYIHHLFALHSTRRFSESLSKGYVKNFKKSFLKITFERSSQSQTMAVSSLFFLNIRFKTVFGFYIRAVGDNQLPFESPI